MARIRFLLVRAGLLLLAVGAGRVRGYRDVELVPGQQYLASEVKDVHALVRRYMRYSTAASSFVTVQDGWAACGLACQSPDVNSAMLNYTWHVDLPLSDGFVAVHHENQEIVIAWAGTHRYRALITNMAVFPLTYIEGANMGVHGGFLESVRGVISPVERHLKRLMDEYPNYMVVITGHSKGGAEASLSALDLVRTMDGLRDRVRVWTFGEPRTGDAQFAAYYNRKLGHATYRVTSYADPVVEMPPRFLFGYCHHGMEVWLHNGDGDIYVGQNSTEGCNEDPRASSSVDFYERTVQWHKNYLGLPPADHANALFSW